MIVIIIFIYLLVRIFYIEVAYDDMLNYIHRYNCSLVFRKNPTNEERIDYDEMMSVHLYFAMFWLWDKWAIIVNPNTRVKLKYFVEKMEYEDREH